MGTSNKGQEVRSLPFKAPNVVRAVLELLRLAKGMVEIRVTEPVVAEPHKPSPYRAGWAYAEYWPSTSLLVL